MVKSPSFSAVRPSALFHRIKIVSWQIQDAERAKLTRGSDLFEQIAPKLYHETAYAVGQLKVLTNLQPPFTGSVFTTSEISFCDIPNLSRKSLEGTFYGFEVITTVGTYAWEERGGIIFWDDDALIPLRPGATVLFPAGTKCYSFVPVAPHESRFLFRQYCHRGALRWVKKGCCSDAEFNASATDDELAAWQAKSASRGKWVAKLFSKLKDVYVF
ncbi:hypothetical protein FB451DRAFT_1036210 [Mycena latifolia]|nr:hypothetical protein FB451DRAFT_1036210 [Mycena latifolia]